MRGLPVRLGFSPCIFSKATRRADGKQVAKSPT
jgi:hypothetical protein